MAALTLTLTESERKFLDRQVKATGCRSAEEYLHRLLLDESRVSTDDEELERLLLEGVEALDRGEGIEVNRDWWKQKLERLTHDRQAVRR